MIDCLVVGSEHQFYLMKGSSCGIMFHECENLAYQMMIWLVLWALVAMFYFSNLLGISSS